MKSSSVKCWTHTLEPRCEEGSQKPPTPRALSFDALRIAMHQRLRIKESLGNEKQLIRLPHPGTQQRFGISVENYSSFCFGRLFILH